MRINILSKVVVQREQYSPGFGSVQATPAATVHRSQFAIFACGHYFTTPGDLLSLADPGSRIKLAYAVYAQAGTRGGGFYHYLGELTGAETCTASSAVNGRV